MFESIRRRLLFSYLLVLSLTLAGAGAVFRVLFAHSLSQQVTEKLTTLAQGAASSVDLENGTLELENGSLLTRSDFPSEALLAQDQALEWFDLQGKPIAHQGRALLRLPFAGKGAVQFAAGSPGIRGVTLPVVDSDTGRTVGYVRATQSLEEFDEALRHFDWGMGGGILVALGLSTVGGILLTRQAMQPIEQSFEQLKQFTADASHELRSPLMAIASNAQVALRYSTGIRPGDAEKFALIVNTVKQLTHLTEDLLLLARTDSQPIGQHRRVQVEELLTHLVQLYQPHASAKSITLKYTQQHLASPLYVEGDEAKLRRLFTNLVDNALHYTPEGGQVTVYSHTHDSQLFVTVTDSGIGIAPDQIRHVFDRFWRAESSRHYQTGGSGLGLAIAQAIARQHHGTISVTSQLGVGSCFSVRLPVSAASDRSGSGDAKDSQKRSD